MADFIYANNTRQLDRSPASWYTTRARNRPVVPGDGPRCEIQSEGDESSTASMLSRTSNSAEGAGEVHEMNCAAPMSPSCRKQTRENQRKRRRIASAREDYSAASRGSGTSGFISRLERTHLANAADVVGGCRMAKTRRTGNQWKIPT